ncbi:MAG: alpha/beta hydrolase [Ramlibacter sp.]
MSPTPRETIQLRSAGEPSLVLRRQRATTAGPAGEPAADVIYVHGATFGADLSVFHPFDGRSWADVLCEAGFTAWGFDFAGYGASDRYAVEAGAPKGRCDEVLPQLSRIVDAVRERNGGRRVVLLAHSWGTIVAARYAGTRPDHILGLVLFGPIVVRQCAVMPTVGVAQPPTRLVTVWQQYRRFVEDVPRDQAQVLGEAHFQVWSEKYLATDPGARDRQPPSVLTPSGPMADIAACWSGDRLYDPAAITAPTLVVRGEWDSLCPDSDALALVGALGATVKVDVKIARATHLMHLETARTELHRCVNDFLHQITH